MPVEYSDPKVHEDVVTVSLSVSLSELLQEFGLNNTPLMLKGRIPDIFTVVDGVRVVLELKEEGEEKALENQLKERLNANICELAVGILYPKRVAESPLAPPTVEEIKDRLLRVKLCVMALAPALNGPKFLVEREFYPIHQLPRLLRTLAHQALPDKEVEEAISRIRDSIDAFVKSINEIPKRDRKVDVEEIARIVKEVLESAE